MMNTPKTDIMRKLDDDFSNIFTLPLPPIDPPLSPEMMAEGDETAERR